MSSSLSLSVHADLSLLSLFPHLLLGVLFFLQDIIIHVTSQRSRSSSYLGPPAKEKKMLAKKKQQQQNAILLL